MLIYQRVAPKIRSLLVAGVDALRGPRGSVTPVPGASQRGGAALPALRTRGGGEDPRGCSEEKGQGGLEQQEKVRFQLGYDG